jgi:uncharacterized protein YdhG (YjbR/CyaY superfamily)
MATRPSFDNTDAYLQAATPEARAALGQIRALVMAAVPEASECFAYQMPAFRLKKIFLYVGAFQHHIGVYPPVRDAALAAELAPYQGPGGNLKFPLEQPLPAELITRVALALAGQYAS